jgi:hypothetical protein
MAEQALKVEQPASKAAAVLLLWEIEEPQVAMFRNLSDAHPRQFQCLPWSFSALAFPQQTIPPIAAHLPHLVLCPIRCHCYSVLDFRLVLVAPNRQGASTFLGQVVLPL